MNSRAPDYRERLRAVMDALLRATPDDSLPALNYRALSEWLAQFPVFDVHESDSNGSAAKGAADLSSLFGTPVEEKAVGRSPTAVTATVQQSCTGCGTVLPAAAKFCPECGRTVTGTRRCINCNGLIQEDAKFCASCGFRLA